MMPIVHWCPENEEGEEEEGERQAVKTAKNCYRHLPNKWLLPTPQVTVWKMRKAK